MQRFLILLSLLAVAAIVFSRTTLAAPPDNPTWEQTNFWFRDDDGAETGATGYGDGNITKNISVSDAAAGSAFRLRLALKVTNADGTISPRLEFTAGTNCVSGTWTAITASSSNFAFQSSSYFADGDPTTKQIATGSFVAGKILESTNPASPVTVAKNKNTEYEWSLKTNDAVSAATAYAFRITDNGTALSTYSQCPTLTTRASPPSPPGDEAAVTFSGRAYPGAVVSIAAKEVGRELIIDRVPVIAADGSFSFTADHISRWYPTYSVLVSDTSGRRAHVKNYNMDTYANDVIVREVFASPTVSLARPLVTQGDVIVVTGAATPGSTVIGAVDGQVMAETAAADRGTYRLALTTTALAPGVHTLQTRQRDRAGQVSDDSPQTPFTVSEITVPKADLNGDGILTIGDWSIFTGRWRAQSATLKEMIDFNDDGKINISDFSIFIRAFRTRLPLTKQGGFGGQVPLSKHE